VEHLNLRTSDGHLLPADLRSATEPAAGALVICHPHPLYGGNRFSVVVDTVFRGAPPQGYHSLRFDFRADHDQGRGEQLDVIAALDLLSDRWPDLPLHVIGYSFGAMVAISLHDPRVSTIVAIAPPLGLGSDSANRNAPGCPILIMSPAQDQFCPPLQAEEFTRHWADRELVTIEMADHSLSGSTAKLMPVITDWLSRAQPASPQTPHR
jgi:uncharacterized protein